VVRIFRAIVAAGDVVGAVIVLLLGFLIGSHGGEIGFVVILACLAALFIASAVALASRELAWPLFIALIAVNTLPALLVAYAVVADVLGVGGIIPFAMPVLALLNIVALVAVWLAPRYS
jgi:hypothetical protein